MFLVKTHSCQMAHHSFTSVKMNEYGCRDAPCENRGNKEILSNTIKDTSTIMRNPLSELCREGYA